MNVSIKEAKNRLTELARRAEKGERVTITRHGRPIADLVPHREEHGMTFEAAQNFLKRHGFEDAACFVAEDFDEPLPEDFLIRSLPE